MKAERSGDFSVSASGSTEEEEEDDSDADAVSVVVAIFVDKPFERWPLVAFRVVRASLANAKIIR